MLGLGLGLVRPASPWALHSQGGAQGGEQRGEASGLPRAVRPSAEHLRELAVTPLRELLVTPLRELLATPLRELVVAPLTVQALC